MENCNEEERRVATGQEKILQAQGKIREFYLESGKLDISKKSQELKFNTADLIPLN